MREHLKLTPIRRRVLARLVTRNTDRDGCESAGEIADALREPKVTHSAVTNALRGLANQGFAGRAGSTFTNARTWAATDAGREAHHAALAETP